MRDPSYKRLNLVLAPEQYASVKERADERGLSVQALIRRQLEVLTGVEDPIRSNLPRRET